MNAILSRESYAPTSGKKLETLLVNGEKAAVVGPIQPSAADLFVSYYGEQWKWWAIVEGVSGGAWLVRSAHRPSDVPLVLDPADQPAIVRSSWDSPPPERAKIRTRGRKQSS